MTPEHPETYGAHARVDFDSARHAFTLYTNHHSFAQVAERVPAIRESIPGGMWAHRGTYASEVIQDYVAYLFGTIRDLPVGDPGTPVHVCHTPPAPTRLSRPTWRRLLHGVLEEYNRRMADLNRRHQ